MRHFLPVRVGEHLDGSPWPDDVTDFLDVEQLPRTPESGMQVRCDPAPETTGAPASAGLWHGSRR